MTTQETKFDHERIADLEECLTEHLEKIEALEQHFDHNTERIKLLELQLQRLE